MSLPDDLYKLIVVNEFVFKKGDFHSAGLARTDDRSQKLQRQMEIEKKAYPESRWPLTITLFMNKPGQDLFKLNIKAETDTATIEMFVDMLRDLEITWTAPFHSEEGYRDFLFRKYGAVQTPEETIPTDSGGEEDPPNTTSES